MLYSAAGHGTRLLELNGIKQKIQGLCDVFWCDTLYLVYGRNYSSYRIVRLAAALKRRIIIHWIGSDVLQAAASSNGGLSGWNADFRHIDLACAPHLADELAEIGISAEYVPILPVENRCELVPMPPSHAVLAYIPEDREQFYGIETAKSLAAKHPDIPFYIVANRGKNDVNKLSNIHYLGMLDREALHTQYAKSSILLRCTEHDGLPVMILEAMQLGRQVIYNFRFPYAHTPETRDIGSIEKLFDELTSAPPNLNDEGRKYVNDTFTNELIYKRYQEIGII